MAVEDFSIEQPYHAQKEPDWSQSFTRHVVTDWQYSWIGCRRPQLDGAVQML
jgi:hypothetical protein